MRVATISLNINAPDFNYGAILHSWAFARYLTKLDFIDSVTILDYTMPSLEGQNLCNPLFDYLKGFKLKKAFKLLFNFRDYQERYFKFQSFIEKMPVSEKQYTQKLLSSEKLDYDAIVVESDVVWAPGFTRNKSELFDSSFFLAHDNMQDLLKIAYAPSMANAEFSEQELKQLQRLLKSIDAISCRESYEKTLLEKLSNKRVQHVLDPVMLLEEKDYSSITSSRLITEKYALIYLPVDDNSQLRKTAKKYAEENGLVVLEISTNFTKCNGVYSFTNAGPQEFLSAIKYAETVFTNSFHAICFSLIFKKQFYAFSRKYSGKVKDICCQFNLENRFFSDDFFHEVAPINYAEVKMKIDRRRKISQQWLINHLLDVKLND